MISYGYALSWKLWRHEYNAVRKAYLYFIRLMSKFFSKQVHLQGVGTYIRSANGNGSILCLYKLQSAERL